MHKGIAICILFIVSYYSVAKATYGVDISSPVDKSEFTCLKKNGFDFAVVRCYQSIGRPDPAGPQSVKDAW
jgi:hypothetical protein